jgi:hypothetical protein
MQGRLDSSRDVPTHPLARDEFRCLRDESDRQVPKNFPYPYWTYVDAAGYPRMIHRA